MTQGCVICSSHNFTLHITVVRDQGVVVDGGYLFHYGRSHDLRHDVSCCHLRMSSLGQLCVKFTLGHCNQYKLDTLHR